MSVSMIQILNNALLTLGGDEVLDETESSVGARAGRQFYPIVRDDLLRKHNWKFAIKRKELGALGVDPLWKWAKAFELPPDCLRIIEVLGQDTETWDVEGTAVVTNTTTCSIKYVSRIEDETMFDASFVETFSLALALKLAIPLTANFQIVQMIGKAFREQLENARTMNAFEEGPRTFTSNELLNFRR